MKLTLTAATSIAVMALQVTGLASTAHADAPATRDPRVNARQHTQQQRIVQGARSGELTRREARHLAADQRDIRQLERAYKSDGKLTATERRDLHQEQNQASRSIKRQKHDGQER